MGFTMSDEGGLELFEEFFVAAANLAGTSSSFAVVSSSLAVVSSGCWTTASNFRSTTAKRRSQRSQPGRPFPVLRDDDSIRHRRFHEYQFQTREQLRVCLLSVPPPVTTRSLGRNSYAPCCHIITGNS